MTNLRLPGQYDERLLGSLGLQGPYYNWNRWYLPGVGRYLEFDPLALEDGLNGIYRADWYTYGNSNPLTFTDRYGLYTRETPLPAHHGDPHVGARRRHPLGHEQLSSTQLYTQVTIRKLKEIHTATHPAPGSRGRRTRAGKPRATVPRTGPRSWPSSMPRATRTGEAPDAASLDWHADGP